MTSKYAILLILSFMDSYIEKIFTIINWKNHFAIFDNIMNNSYVRISLRKVVNVEGRMKRIINS